MYYRNFEVTSIKGFIKVPCRNSMGYNLGNIEHANYFSRYIKRSIHSILEVAISVEETTATIEVTARPTIGDPHGEILGQTIASYFKVFS